MTKNTIPIYVGMMSGTSMDGVDAVAAMFNNGVYQFIGRSSAPYSQRLRTSLLELCTSGPDEVARVQSSANEVAKMYARVFHKLLEETGLEVDNIRAVGAHGQTIRHNPKMGASTQIINGALLAELTGTDVIVDFRSRDLAAGGEGAPLVPLFHKTVFSGTVPRGILNIGGIANLTYLPAKDEEAGNVFGFDCGPGNVLMDAWTGAINGTSYDRDGLWARSGRVSEDLLARLKSEAYFAGVPPKSTGRELFNLAWLQSKLEENAAEESAENVQRTLLALTAESVTEAIDRFAPDIRELWICGGGARNQLLMQEIKRLNPARKVDTTAGLGLDAQDVEGAAFAWLAKRFIERQPGNLPSATGAKGERILGALYPA